MTHRPSTAAPSLVVLAIAAMISTACDPQSSSSPPKAKVATLPDAKTRTLATGELAHSWPETSEPTTVIIAAPVENTEYLDFDKTIPRGFSDSQENEEGSEQDEPALSKARRSTKYKRLSKPLQPGQYDD